MIRLIENQTRLLKSLLASPMSTLGKDSVAYRAETNLGTGRLKVSSWCRPAIAASLALSAFIGLGSSGAAKAEVSFNDGAPKVGDVAVDIGALGSETSAASMACWQGGKEIFSAAEFNTVLLGGLAGESAITLKNNTNGTQALAISLENGVCFVTIEP